MSIDASKKATIAASSMDGLTEKSNHLWGAVNSY